jgi:hypothetical protein
LTNIKIEKLDIAIAAAKQKLTYYNARLRDLERERRVQEDAEIVAFFRKENFTEDDLALLRRMKVGVSPGTLAPAGRGVSSHDNQTGECEDDEA